MNSYTAYTTLNAQHLHHWYVKCKFMRNHTSNASNLPTQYMDGTLEPPLIITDVTPAILLTQEERPHQIQ